MEVDYKAFLKALGTRIKQFRLDRGWKLRDMVVKFGYHDSQWRKYESGGGLTIPSLLRIAALFEVSLSRLLDGLAEFPAQSIEEIKDSHAMKRASRQARASRRK